MSSAVYDQSNIHLVFFFLVFFAFLALASSFSGSHGDLWSESCCVMKWSWTLFFSSWAQHWLKQKVIYEVTCIPCETYLVISLIFLLLSSRKNIKRQEPLVQRVVKEGQKVHSETNDSCLEFFRHNRDWGLWRERFVETALWREPSESRVLLLRKKQQQVPCKCFYGIFKTLRVGGYFTSFSRWCPSLGISFCHDSYQIE